MKQTHIISFDKIHKKARGEKISGKDLKTCQTVQHDRVKQCTKKEQDNFLFGDFRTKRSDLYFEKELVNNHFRCQILIVLEFDVFHKFVNEIKHVFSQKFGKFSMTHNAFDTDFTIFIEYNAELFNIDIYKIHQIKAICILIIGKLIDQ